MADREEIWGRKQGSGAVYSTFILNFTTKILKFCKPQVSVTVYWSHGQPMFTGAKLLDAVAWSQNLVWSSFGTRSELLVSVVKHFIDGKRSVQNGVRELPVYLSHSTGYS